MPPRKLFFENVRVGDEIPALAKAPIDRVQIARYAGALNDYAPYHVDESYAKGIGMPSVFAHSTIAMGFLGQVITDWSRGTTLVSFAVRYSKLIWPGDTLVCKGRVTDRWGTGGSYFIELEVWAENQKGELALKGQAVLKLFMSAEDETRQRTGQGPIIHEIPRESIRLAQAAAARAKEAKPEVPEKGKAAKSGPLKKLKK